VSSKIKGRLEKKKKGEIEMNAGAKLRFQLDVLLGVEISPKR
jgi:hypothetical protein